MSRSMSKSLLDHLTVDMVQCQLLSHIFSKSLRGKLAVKGGMAMRVGQSSPRFTKDIDLAADSRVPKEAIQHAIRLSMRDLRASNLIKNMSFSEPKQTDTTLRWKIQGQVGASDIHLTVEISRRNALTSAHVNTIRFEPPSDYRMPPVVCECFDATALAATKTTCLLDSKREAPRDIYDLFVLIRAQVFPPVSILRNLPRETLAKGLKTMWSMIEKMDYATAKTQLKSFLPEKEAEAFDESTWEEMRLVVSDQVDGWLKAAMEPLQALTAEPELEREEFATCRM